VAQLEILDLLDSRDLRVLLVQPVLRGLWATLAHQGRQVHLDPVDNRELQGL